MAVRVGNNKCAEYLLERIRLNKETQSVLSCRDDSGLSILHLAVDFAKCSQDQVNFVSLLISHYPDALTMKSGEITYGSKAANSEPKNPNQLNANRLGQYEQFQNTSSTRVKSSAAPYKYFIESKEQFLNSNHQQHEPKKDRTLARRAKKEGSRNGSLQSSGNSKSTQESLGGTQSSTKPGDNPAEKMDDLLKLSCMRYFGRDRRILTELLDSQVGCMKRSTRICLQHALLTLYPEPNPS